jgi:hypothetical protein
MFAYIECDVKIYHYIYFDLGRYVKIIRVSITDKILDHY